MPEPRHRQRIVIIGAGFAGFHAARTLSRLARHLGRQAAEIEIVLINPTDYFLYLPLLPEVAGRRAGSAPGGRAVARWLPRCPAAGRHRGRDRPPQAGGSACTAPRAIAARCPTTGCCSPRAASTSCCPIPGVAQHAHGFRSLAETLYLRDHLLRQIELAAATDDPAEREARCTFVVVGAGYTGTEVAAHGQLFTRAVAGSTRPARSAAPLAAARPGPARCCPNWTAGSRPPRDRTLTRRGVEIRTGTSVTEATSGGVQLSDGQFVPTRSLIWCVGVRPTRWSHSSGCPPPTAG